VKLKLKFIVQKNDEDSKKKLLRHDYGPDDGDNEHLLRRGELLPNCKPQQPRRSHLHTRRREYLRPQRNK
jgi:hypothetical protein